MEYIQKSENNVPKMNLLRNFSNQCLDPSFYGPLSFHFRLLISFLCFFLISHPGSPSAQGTVSAAQKANAQEVLAKLDSELNLGNGLWKGSLILINRSGRSETWKISVFRENENSLFLLERKGRGLETKILSLDEGDKIFVFNAISSKLFRKQEDEKYENFQNTGFSFVDLSGYLYQANYDPLVNGDTRIGNEDFIRVTLRPIITYEYKKLVLLSKKSGLIPNRIDFHDRDGVLFKTLNIKYSRVKKKTNAGVDNLELAARWEMLDLGTGNIAVLEFQEIDATVKMDKSLFDVENLGR
jgi:hypothetical protein